MWFETRWLGGILGAPSDEQIAAEIGDCPNCDEEVFDPYAESNYASNDNFEPDD